MKPRSTHITSSCMTTSQKHNYRHGSEENISEINNEQKALQANFQLATEVNS